VLLIDLAGWLAYDQAVSMNGAMTQTIRPPRSKRFWTFDELVEELPESNQPCELWDGELIMPPAPDPLHQDIVFSIARRLDAFVRRRKLGKVFITPIDVVFTQSRVVQPDVIYISNKNRRAIQDRIRGVPDLVVEVISEGSWRRDRVDKRTLYEQFSVPEYWIIDPESETIEVFILSKGTYRVHCKAAGNEKATSKLLLRFSVSFEELEEG
jgi:Uma2 family endonuclease